MGHLGVIQKAVAAGKRCAWFTHTKQLVTQTAARLGAGIIAAGHAPCDRNPIQVASIQTLLARDHWEPFDVVVFDECHHAAAPRYRELIELWRGSYWLGLTATPQRADGRPLGDLYDALVVAAQHSELLKLGHLVPCRVFRPASELDRGIAMNVVAAVMKYGEGRCGFVYVSSIKEARYQAELLSMAGFASTCVDEETDRDVRNKALEGLATGRLRFIVNVDTMSEGVDVPNASICILACNIGHLSTAIQRWGRVLRSTAGKRDAVICDLPGLTHRPGWVPLSDLEYSLDGSGIRPAANGGSLRVCLRCGFVWETGNTCPECGWRGEERVKPQIRIYNQDLLEVYCGQQTPDWAKKQEWERLQKLCEGRKINEYFAVSQYRKLFNEDPPREIRQDAADQHEKWLKIVAEGKAKNYKPGWAAFRFRLLYGASPPRAWLKEAQSS